MTHALKLTATPGDISAFARKMLQEGSQGGPALPLTSLGLQRLRQSPKCQFPHLYKKRFTTPILCTPREL